MVSTTTAAIVIFVAAYALIISEKVHRTIVGIVGAMLMILFGVLDQETAIRHIDFNTLGLLMGMMIIVNITSETDSSTSWPSGRPRRSRRARLLCSSRSQR